MIPEVMFWAARLGWLIAAWALIAGLPQGVAIGLLLTFTHLALGPSYVEVKPAPERTPR
jgi:uncharacterized protein (DUF58 family)